MKYIIKNCPYLVNSTYANGKEVANECGESLLDEKCCEISACTHKSIANRLMRVVEADACSRCDGCGYDNGCCDENCGTYQAQKCLALLDIEEVPKTLIEDVIVVLHDIQQRVAYLQVHAWNISEKGYGELNKILEKLNEIEKEV